MIKIDGSYGEGGGQILRTAVGLSVAKGKPCTVFNIRKKRKKPGLMRSHLATLIALERLSNGSLQGAKLGSTSITFYPGKIQKKEIGVEIKTAGSITLVLQGIFLSSLFSGKEVSIEFKGGATDTFFSPTTDHFRFVFLKLVEKMGGRAQLLVKRRGFYPEGKARVLAHIKQPEEPEPRPLVLKKPGQLQKVFIASGASQDLQARKVAERQVSGVKQVLGKLNLPLEEKIEYYPSQSTGSQVNIIAQLDNTVFGTDNLGKMGKSAEQVGKEAGLAFLEEVRSQACLDKYTADQILPYLALAPGKSEISVSKITPHCRTNMWTVEQFVKGRFNAEENLIAWHPA